MELINDFIGFKEWYKYILDDENGGASRTRTNAYRICNPGHYQLCYSSNVIIIINNKKSKWLVCKYKWQRARDSNPRRREPRRFSKPVHSTNSGNPLLLLMVRTVGIEPTLRNRNWILSPTRLPIPPRSHTKSIYEVVLLKLDGNYNRFFSFCQGFLKRISKSFKISIF